MTSDEIDRRNARLEGEGIGDWERRVIRNEEDRLGAPLTGLQKRVISDRCYFATLPMGATAATGATDWRST